MSDDMRERRELAAWLKDHVKAGVFYPGIDRLSNRAAELLLAPAADWQPIETAPKDGTLVLLAEGRSVRPGYYHEWNGGREWAWQELGGRNADPSHWMPLPPPPSESEPTPQRPANANAAWRSVWLNNDIESETVDDIRRAVQAEIRMQK